MSENRENHDSRPLVTQRMRLHDTTLSTVNLLVRAQQCSSGGPPGASARLPLWDNGWIRMIKQARIQILVRPTFYLVHVLSTLHFARSSQRQRSYKDMGDRWDRIKVHLYRIGYSGVVKSAILANQRHHAKCLLKENVHD